MEKIALNEENGYLYRHFSLRDLEDDIEYANGKELLSNKDLLDLYKDIPKLAEEDRRLSELLAIPEPQSTQLDRIEEQLAARNDALRQEGADALTLELLERGIL